MSILRKYFIHVQKVLQASITKKITLCIPHHYVEYLSITHTIVLKEIDIQNIREPSNMCKVCLTCAHATNQIQR